MIMRKTVYYLVERWHNPIEKRFAVCPQVENPGLRHRKNIYPRLMPGEPLEYCTTRKEARAIAHKLKGRSIYWAS